MKKITLINLATFLVLLFSTTVGYGQCPDSYASTSTTITLHFEGGNNADDYAVACKFILAHGGASCSGGSIIVAGNVYTFNSLTNGTLIYTTTATLISAPTKFQIAEGIGCGKTSDNGDFTIYFNDQITANNCSSSNGSFSFTINYIGANGPYQLIQASGISALNFPMNTNLVSGTTYTDTTIKTGYYSLVFQDSNNSNNIETVIYEYVSKEGVNCYRDDDVLFIDKTIFFGNPYTADGDEVTYQYAVTSSVSVTGPITVTDNKISTVTYYSGTGNGNTDNILQVGETWIYTGSYEITSADVINKSVTNVAVAKGFVNGFAIFSDGDEATAYLCNLSATVIATNATCNGGTGSITISSPSGGSGTYQYSKDGGSNWQSSGSFTGLIAGTYQIVIKDANATSCVIDLDGTAGTVVGQPAAALVASISSSTNVNCFGGTTGSATASATGGTVSYTYSWNTSPVQTTATATNLAAGTYTVTVTDSKGCTDTEQVTITEPAAALVASISSSTNVNCFGGTTGSATASATGGTVSYTYSWNTSPVQTTATATNLAAGTYTVTVTDSKGCTDTKQVTITEPAAALSANATGESLYCAGDTNGDITLTVQGGTPSYTYSWKKTGDNVTIVSTAQNPIGLSAGTYNVTVTDANGCSTTASATIIDGDGTDPVVTAPADSSLEGCSTSAITGWVYSESLVDITSSYAGVGVVETGGSGIASVKYSDTKSGTCPIVVTRTFTVTDNCGNVGTDTQLINILDTTAPVLTIPANAAIECTADITPGALGAATATDNCDGSLTPTYTDGDCFGLENEKEVNAGGGIYQYFNISGMAGLGVNSIKDFTLTFETNQGKGRAEFILVAPNGKGIVLVGPYCATGDCNDNDGGTESYSPTFYPSTSGYAAWNNNNPIPEGAGNFTPNGGTTTNTVAGLTNGLVSSFEALTAGMASLDGQWFIYSKKQENVNGNVRFISSCLTPALSTSCAKNNVIIREWTVTDACGNGATGNQVIVISDTTVPVVTGAITDTELEGCSISVAPAAVTTVAALEALTGTLSISDNCSADADLSVSSSDAVNGTCPIVITRTYKVTDECSNVSVDIVHTIKINDTTKPTGTAPANITGLKKISDVPAPDVSLITNEADNCSTATVTFVKDENNGATGCFGAPYIVTRTYKITDDCNNFIEVIQTITVESDVVTVDDPADVTECESYTLPALNSGNYFTGTGGTGTALFANDVITSSQIIYVYAASANNANCTDENSFSVTINALPAAPSAQDQTVCETNPIQTLTATATVPDGFSVVWYDAETGGDVVPSPNLNTVGAITYYAESVNDATECTSSSRTAVTLTINAAPVAPESGGDQTVCSDGTTTQTLTATATGGTITWYTTETGGSPIEGNPTQVGVGSVTYYAESSNGTCSSLTRTAVTLTINAAPVAPESGGDQTVCSDGTTTQTLTATATGGTITWYTTETGGSPIEGNPTQVGVGSVTYYAESSNGTCSSLTRTAVTLTINAAPAVPISGGNQIVCSNGSPTQTLMATATGGTIIWYTAATGGNVVVSPTQVGVGSVTYYAESNNGTCSSLSRTAVTLTINPAPAAPTSGGNQTVCSNGSPTQTLTATATGGTITWYTAATGGSLVTSPTQVGVGSVTYYAQSSNGICSSLTRTAVTLTINAAPDAPISGGNQTVCSDGTTTQTLTATATGGTITWYTAATGGSVVANPTQVGVGTSTYYAQSSNGTCSSLTRTAVTLTINAVPDAPISGSNQTVCSNGSPTQTLTATATGGTITWYTAATGGSVVANPTQVGVGSATYYAESSNGTCSSLTRTAVTLTINAAPVAPISGGNQTVCSNGSPTQTLTATATGGTITWYSAAAGGSVVANATQVGVGSVTYYAESSNGTCSSLTRTAVTLTINATPVVTISGNSVLNCINESTTLTASATVQGTPSYLWSTGATTSTINVTAAGNYSVTVTDGNSGCSSVATVTVTGNATPPAASISGNAVLTCTTQSATLVATATVSGTASYLWNTGDTTASITVSAPGEYSVVVLDSSNGCAATATVTVAQNTTQPVVNISGPTELNCNAASITLNASGTTVQGTASYLWNTGATTASIVVNQAGEYTVVVTDSGNGCSGAKTITVAENFVAAEIEGGSIALCTEDSSLNLTSLLPSNFVSGGTWTDDMNSGGLSGSSFDPSVVNLGDFEFTYTEPGDCGRIITVFVNVNADCVVLACSTAEDISKVVTPNGDGINDVFSVGDISAGNTCKYIVKIFNRWGKMVYHSDNYLNNWSGRHDGSGMKIGSNSELPTGTYYYIVNIIDTGGSSLKPITGYIYLGTH